MLFNSYVFLFAFVPLALAGFHVLSRLGRQSAAVWLILISLVYYGWWNPHFVALLTTSIGLNYLASEAIGATESRPTLQVGCLALAIAVNLAVLIYYKYLAALLHVATGLGLMDVATPDIILPLGVSFFTFTQIGYLVDVKQGVAKDRGFLNYVLFVTFFPHLIAGPILHNREIMPQFGEAATYRFSAQNSAVGLSIFVIGLSKKCLFADPISVIAGPGFADAAHLPLLAAWNVALCFSLQLYFDFSGYSDMAIGLARMFNIRFPLNFNSPYKATSMIDHWQRWHMTLSRYLALYLYNPLALAVTRWRANRGLGIGRNAQAGLAGFTAMVMFPTLVTMGLAGVWHGAGLQFLVFGLLHGTYLTINHAIRILRPRSPHAPPVSFSMHCVRILVTYLAVLIASVFFGAPSVNSALSLLTGMIGLHGLDPLPMPAAMLAQFGAMGQTLVEHRRVFVTTSMDFMISIRHVLWIICLYVIVWSLPNTQQIMGRFMPALGRIQLDPSDRLVWQLSRGWAVAIGIAACVSVLAIGGTSEFLYFKF